MILKVVETDGIEKFRDMEEDNLREIEFGSQIEHAEEQNRNSVLGK